MPNPEFSRRDFFRFAVGVGSGALLAACDIPGVPSNSKSQQIDQRITLDQQAMTPTQTVEVLMTPSPIDTHKVSSDRQIPAGYKEYLNNVAAFNIALPENLMVNDDSRMSEDTKEARNAILTAMQFPTEFYNPTKQFSFYGRVGFRPIPSYFILDDAIAQEQNFLKEQITSSNKETSYTMYDPKSINIPIQNEKGLIKRVITEVNYKAANLSEIDMDFFNITTCFLRNPNQFWMFNIVTTPGGMLNGLTLCDTSLQTLRFRQ